MDEAAKQPITAGNSQERSLQQEEDKDAVLAWACALVDELELSWESEWQQAAIVDWELE
jgi:hypothetical protein